MPITRSNGKISLFVFGLLISCTVEKWSVEEPDPYISKAAHNISLKSTHAIEDSMCKKLLVDHQWYYFSLPVQEPLA